MEVRKGIPVSPGIAIADVVVLGREELRIRRSYVAASKVDAEVERLDRAIKQSVVEINEELAEFGETCSSLGRYSRVTATWSQTSTSVRKS